MYIREFRVQNFLVHRDTTIRLDPLTVLVGANGGGKSALFDALLNFSMISRGNVRQAFGPYPYSFRATLYRGASSVSRIKFRALLARAIDDPEGLDYEVAYAQKGQAEDQPSFTIYEERLTKQPDGTVLFDRSAPDDYGLTQHARLEDDRSIFSAVRLANPAGASSAVDPLVWYCTQQISRFNKFRLDPGMLAQPNRIPDVSAAAAAGSVPRLGYRGEDLSATLYHLAETENPAINSIKRKVREVDPSFDDFEFNSVGTDRIVFSAKYQDGRGNIPSVRLSAGNLTYIGLLTLVCTDSRPPVMMIEEPENGLTPQAVKSFYQAVRDLANNSKSADRTQILISSHSPFVICEAWNGEDRNFIHQVKVEGGQSKVRRFQEALDAQGTQLQKDSSGARTILGLKTAEEVMSGYLS